MAKPAPPQSTMVYVQQPPVQRETNWGAWGAVIVGLILLVAVGGLMLWNYGYAGLSDNNPAPTNITVENSPQTSTAAEPHAVTPPAVQPQSAPPAATPGPPNLEVVSVSAKATDMNPADWKYSYTVKLRNNTARPLQTGVRVKFLDAQGFVLDDDVLENLSIAPNSEAVFEDYDWLKIDVARLVTTVKAELR